MNPQPFAMPDLLLGRDATAQRSGSWIEETQHYLVRPRPKPKFKTVLDASALFGHGDVRSSVLTRVGGEGPEPVLELYITHLIGGRALRETLHCTTRGGLQATWFRRELESGDGAPARLEEVRWLDGPIQLPIAAYPEVTLPFVMRGQPLDGKRRSVWSWTNDRMIARVYYEMRAERVIDVPAGRFEAFEVWMYPDLNDWISLGSVVTRLAKPLLPRYNFWFEKAPPHRVLRFEGPYGPPSSPEIVLELCNP